jgi:DNA-binding transcriptional ArsR family regulator
MNIDDVAGRLEALGNPTRLRIYRALVRAGDDGLTVGRLQAEVGVAASTLSHHLHRLVLVGLVTQERRSTTLLCRADYPMLSSVMAALVDECCAGLADGERDVRRMAMWSGCR